MQAIQKYWFVSFFVFSLLYIGFYLFQEFQNVDRLLHVSISMVAFTFFLQMGFWFLAGYLWRKIVILVSSVNLSLLESFAQLSLVNLGKYLPGKIWGMLARGSHMSQRHGVATEQIFQATYLEQLFLLISGLALAAMLAGVLFNSQWSWGLAALAIAGVVLGGYYNDGMLRLISSIYARVARNKHRPLLPLTLPLPHYYLYLMLYGVVWVLLGLVFSGLYLSFFSVDLSMRMLATLVLASTAAFILGFLAIFAPGGVGVREAVSSAVLASQMPVQDAVLLSLLFRLWTVTVEVTAGGVLIAILRRPSR